jgi:hypothetical protein
VVIVMRALHALRALLIGLALAIGACVPSECAAEEAEARSPWSPVSVSVPIAFGLSSFWGMEDLNAELRREDYEELGRIIPTVSPAIFVSLENGLVLAPQYRFAIVAGSETTLSMHQFCGNLGYEILRWERQLIVPFVGAGVGLANLDVATPALSSTTFRQVLHDPQHDATLNSVTFLMQAGVMIHLWGSGHGDFVGVTSAVTVAPFESGWKQRGASATGGPSPPMSGAHAAAAVGFTFPWER